MIFGVIADDLTGAFDTGVQFRNWGMSVEVFRGSRSLEDFPSESDVVVVDTESRYDDPETAYGKVFKATEKILSLGVNWLFKKIDSTLRGNLGSEIDAVMDAEGMSVLHAGLQEMIMGAKTPEQVAQEYEDWVAANDSNRK